MSTEFAPLTGMVASRPSVSRLPDLSSLRVDFPRPRS
jgi:hypothetical protein